MLLHDSVKFVLGHFHAQFLHGKKEILPRYLPRIVRIKRVKHRVYFLIVNIAVDVKCGS